MSVYWSEFYLPLLALSKRRFYDVVLSWSLRTGINYAYLNRLVKKTTPKHVLYDFHINVNRSGTLYKNKLALTQKAVMGIDHFFTTSRREEKIYGSMFHIPRERIQFFPIAPPRQFLRATAHQVKEYIFSYGNSDRDYDTLVDACRDAPFRVLILSQNYRAKNLPSNILLLRRKRSHQELQHLVGSARLVVIPLESGEVAAGQTAMLESMAMGRPVIVTENPATVEYARHGETAFFYSAGDLESLRDLVGQLWNDTEQAEHMGRSARIAVSCLPEFQEAFLSETLMKLSESSG